MLAKILEEMWVEPEVLEALSEEQKRILFFKMREEQVRRWRKREEAEDGQAGPKRASTKHVTWLLGRDGDVRVSVIGEEDEFRSSKLLQSLLNNRCHDGRVVDVPCPASVPRAEMHTQDRRPDRAALARCRSVDARMESGGAGDAPRDGASDGDCESGGGGGGGGDGSDNLRRDWTPLCEPGLRYHGNRPPLRAQSLDADRTLPLDRVALAGPAEEPAFGGSVAQLKRTSPPRSVVSSKPPVPVKPPHLQRVNLSVPRQVPEGIAAS